MHAVASPSPSADPSCSHEPRAAFPPLRDGFDERLATAPTITAGATEPDELAVIVLILGHCAAVTPGQTITTNYVIATLRDGKVIDSTWSRKSTVDVAVGLGQLGRTIQVIAGLDRGLVGVKVGSRVQLDIPPNMTYDREANPHAPAGALRVIVDVLDAR
ncbi:FKBP-type peptidyl-prolyl cis-trans isomerase [Dactylosporangium siamense]|uniref:FKBP-type peptidyl-prolyl cis-trans isomerase n=1 Tax=Dactylosporangium siamense TaxID=685454 RepID=UPI0031EEA342